ncbi:glutamate-cysteine ligase, partial [Thalassiosira pseudonana CCMP1335]
GLLKVGTPQPWPTSKRNLNYVREAGVRQFISTYNRVKDLKGDDLVWGDEIEYGIFVLDDENKKVRLSLRAKEIMDNLNANEGIHSHEAEGCNWVPEYGAWMVEATPARPYTGYSTDLLRVERNMRLRRKRILAELKEGEIAPTVAVFPLLGAMEDDGSVPPTPLGGPVTESEYIGDGIINPHPRFGALSANIRKRRGEKVNIRVPLFHDTHTPEYANLPGFAQMFNVRPAIHMDAMAFGMGCCCLQITFQATDVEESRFLFDQLAVMAPIMMALTASTPVLKGRLADTDCRWGIISEGVDDRTPAERGREGGPDPPGDPEMAGKGRRRLYKSRYDSISTYLYQGASTEDSHMKNRILNMYNDIPVPIDEDKYRDLREAGIDPLLSQHIAHIFVRDPLVIFDGAVEEVDDETQTEHFESIQSTNWQTVRWKPPPPRSGPNDPHIGWRTEFRSMEIQLTDFENAAFTTFTTLLTRVILTFDLNLYIPLSRVDANMQRAHGRNAAVKGKFFFHGVSAKRRVAPNASGGPEENSYEEMTMAEIMTGKGDYFPGLIPLVYAYLDHIQCDSVTMERMTKYLDFIEKRATGQLVTPATWVRSFIRNHEDYKFDSVVSDSIAYDLLVACKEIGEGQRAAPELLG